MEGLKASAARHKDERDSQVGGLPVPPRLERAAKGLNRLASSKVARILVTVAILAIAAWLIHNQLQSARFTDVTHAIARTPRWALGACVVFTVLTYACEGVVEWHALRLIGKRLPLGRTLLAASAASALSIAMGFGLASGTAARLRFYAFARLSAADVAKLTALVSGAILVAGLIMLGAAGFGGRSTIVSILHWPGWSVILLSIGLLMALPAWFFLLGKWRGAEGAVLGPVARSATLAGALGNWLFQGAAMFVLASHQLTDFPGFFAAFALASLLGSAVGIPADLGVLEAAVIGSRSLGPAHQAAAALVLFRLIFQLIPLILATSAIVLKPAAKAARKLSG